MQDLETNQILISQTLCKIGLKCVFLDCRQCIPFLVSAVLFWVVLEV